jgi:hypothetical protein
MSVRVVARIRPLLKQELDKDTIVTAETLEGDSAPTVVRLPSPKNDAESFSFQFSSVYEQEATQQQLFDAESANPSPRAVCIALMYAQFRQRSNIFSMASIYRSSHTAAPVPERHIQCEEGSRWLIVA